jgi:S1-C subfamily serine protease
MKVVLVKRDGSLGVSQLAYGGTACEAGLKSSDLVLEVDKNPVRSNSDLNFYLDQKRIGQSTNLTLQRNGEGFDLKVPLERKNSWSFLLVNFLAGLFLWVVGISFF